MGLPTDIVHDPIESVITTIEKYESFVHETRFTTDFDGAWNFTAGIFYQDAEWDHEYPAATMVGINDIINEALFPFFGGPADFAPGDVIFVTNTLTTTEELAFFGELTWEINDLWSITA